MKKEKYSGVCRMCGAIFVYERAHNPFNVRPVKYCPRPRPCQQQGRLLELRKTVRPEVLARCRGSIGYNEETDTFIIE